MGIGVPKQFPKLSQIVDSTGWRAHLYAGMRVLSEPVSNAISKATGGSKSSAQQEEV